MKVLSGALLYAMNLRRAFGAHVAPPILEEWPSIPHRPQ